MHSLEAGEHVNEFWCECSELFGLDMQLDVHTFWPCPGVKPCRFLDSCDALRRTMCERLVRYILWRRSTWKIWRPNSTNWSAQLRNEMRNGISIDSIKTSWWKLASDRQDKGFVLICIAVLLCHFTFHDVSRWTKIRPAPPRDMWSTWVPALPRVATAMAARGPEMTWDDLSATAIKNNKTRIDTPQWVQYCLYLSKATWNHQVDSINWYWIDIECMNLCVLLKQHFL